MEIYLAYDDDLNTIRMIAQIFGRCFISILLSMFFLRHKFFKKNLVNFHACQIVPVLDEIDLVPPELDMSVNPQIQSRHGQSHRLRQLFLGVAMLDDHRLQKIAIHPFAPLSCRSVELRCFSVVSKSDTNIPLLCVSCQELFFFTINLFIATIENGERRAFCYDHRRKNP